MKRILAVFCFAAIAASAYAGPAAGRTLVLDVAKPDNAWSTTVTRGESIYVRVDLYNRGAAYTNNDLRGYLWYASNSVAQSGVSVASATNERGSVWFLLSATDTLGLSTNDAFPTSYFAQVVLTNATVKYDWSQGRVTCRHGAGISATGSAAITTLNNGGSLTNLNASELRSGTVPLARLSGITSNQIDATTDAAYRSGGASGLTNSGVTLAPGANVTLNGGVVSLPLTNGATITIAASLSGGGITSADFSNLLATVANTGTYYNATVLDGVTRANLTNGLDTVSARQSAVAASTQTIAGASVAGTVAAASWSAVSGVASNLAPGSASNTLAAAVTNRGAVIAAGANVTLNGGTDPAYITNGATITIAATLSGGGITSAEFSNLLSAVATTGTYYNATTIDGVSRTDLTSGYVKASITTGLDSVVSVDGKTNTLRQWTESRVNDATQTIAGASVSGAVPSATVAATATNALQLAGIAAASYITNNQTGVTLGLAAGTTVADATETNQPVTLHQLRDANTGNKALWFTTNLITSATYTNTSGVATGTTYKLVGTTTEIPPQSTLTIPSVSIGAYYLQLVFTNTTYTTFVGQDVSAEIFLSENSAGSSYTKAEVYRVEPSTSNWIEWGTAAASNLVAAQATPVSQKWAIPVDPIATNVPFNVGLRIKRMGGTASPDIIFGVGSNYPSYVSITLPSSVMLQGYATSVDLSAATSTIAGASVSGTVSNANNLIVAGGGASGPQLTGYLNADLEPFWEFQRTDNPFNEHMFFGWHTNFGTSIARAGIGWYSTTSLKRWGLYNYATDGTVGLSVGQSTNYLYLFGKQGNVPTNGATNVVFSGILKLTNLVVNGDINVASTNFNGTRGIAASFWYAGDTDSWIKVRAGLTTDYRAYLAWTPYDSDNYHWVMGRDMATNFVLYSPVADSHTIYSDPRGDTHFQAASNGWLKFNAMAGQGSTNGVVFYSGGSAPGEIAKIAASGAGRMASLNLTNDSYNAVNTISGGTVFERFCWLANQRVLVKDTTSYAEFLASGGAGIQIAPNYDESVNGGFFFTANSRLGIATNLPEERLDVNGSALIRTNLTVSGTITSSVMGCTKFNLDGTNAVRASQNYDYATVSSLASNLAPGIASNTLAAALTNDGRIATIATNMQSWGYTDPAPTSAIQNVQWALWPATGTIRRVVGDLLTGSLVADLIERNRTNAAGNYTTIYTGLTFGIVATNVPFTRALQADYYYGLITTNVATGSTNWTVSIGWTP